MDPLSDDRALLDSFRLGERSALERVYYAYVDRVFNLVRHGFPLEDGRRVEGLREPHAQRDAVQDIFIRAFAESARLSYDGLRPYAPYLLRIAKNRLIDLWRSRGVELSATEALAALEAAEPPMIEDAAEDLHWRKLREATQACIAEMDEEMQKFVRWRFEEDLGQRDVAERMGITRRRVRTLESRVLARLADYLQRRGVC